MTHVEYLKELKANATTLRDTLLKDIDEGGYTAKQIWCASKNEYKVQLISIEKGIRRLRHQQEYNPLHIDLDSAFIRTLAEGLDALESGSDCL